MVRFIFLLSFYVLCTSPLFAQYTGGKDDGYAMAEWSNDASTTTSTDLVKVSPTIIKQGTIPQLNFLVEDWETLSFQLLQVDGKLLEEGTLEGYRQTDLKALFSGLSAGTYLWRFFDGDQEQVVRVVIL